MSFLRSMKKRAYIILIENNNVIRNEYLRYKQAGYDTNLVDFLKKIVAWNFKYRLLKTYYQRKLKRLKYPENVYNKRNFSLANLRDVEKAEVIVFELFDNLLICPFLEKKNLFSLMERSLKCGNFMQVRLKYERVLKDNNDKFALSDIYSLLAEKCGIDAITGECMEKQLIEELYFVNEELKTVLKELKKKGKRICVKYDSYYDLEFIDRLLEKNEIFDCELVTTSDEKNFFCIDANHNYKSILKHGMLYRDNNMSYEIGCIYSVLCNSWIYQKDAKFSMFYEFGFTCGGILVIGLCQWLNRLVKEKNIEKMLFLSRDGDIVHKVYNKYYKAIESEYVYFSRMVSEQLTFHRNIEEYINYVILPELEQKPEDFTIGELFARIGLNEIKGIWEQEYGTCNAKINHISKDDITDFIIKNRMQISDIFEKTNMAANFYFSKMISKNQNICLFDIGWRGTSIVYLDYLLSEKFKITNNIYGALLGSGCENYANDYLLSGIISSFVFSKYKNNDIMNVAFENDMRILTMELLFSSPEPSLLSYNVSESENCKFIFQKNNEMQEEIRQIHAGILDFVKLYHERLGAYGENIIISERDAFAPLLLALKNEKYISKLLEKNYFYKNARHGYEVEE